MVLPAILGGAMVAGATLKGANDIGKAYDTYRYWSDYQRNTRVHAKYPWRSGVYDYVGLAGSGVSNFARAGYGSTGLYNLYKG